VNVLIISQCEKGALAETRRILDQFAERRGDRTWQTPITQIGLETLRKMLRKTARKNTAVICHWIRSKDHSEVLWTVGDGSKFNSQGAVPTNTTARNIRKSSEENSWHNGTLIGLLSTMSALLHDLGKACKAFQDKVNPALGKAPSTEANIYRHEWVSLRLFQCFVLKFKGDAEWLETVAKCDQLQAEAFEDLWLQGLLKDGEAKAAEGNYPLQTLEAYPIAKQLAWLVVSHHRLPQIDAPFSRGSDSRFRNSMLEKWPSIFDASWNGSLPSDDKAAIKRHWKFEHGLPLTNSKWRKEAARAAKGFISLCKSQERYKIAFQDPFAMHISRLNLMLADHQYSSFDSTKDGATAPERELMEATGLRSENLVANTAYGLPNQRLDEHLVGVAKRARQVQWTLTQLDKYFQRPTPYKALRKRSTQKDFLWQNRAVDTAASMQVRSELVGAFVVNMASTGKGKTVGNAKIMYALSNEQKGMRCAFAMGLRTLTLQTGKAFKELLALNDESLAIRVGGSATRELFDRSLQEAENTGSESSLSLLDEASEVTYDNSTSESPILDKLFQDHSSRKLLDAPLLVCTIDHLIPATESDRGGRQIAPMLRLMTSDLVLDEPDDFDIADFPALARLVNWAGLLGSRVLLSSATLPPALVIGLFDAYREGRRHFDQNRARTAVAPNAEPSICCIWVDEFNASASECPSLEEFSQQHSEFVAKRVSKLEVQPSQRRARLIQFADVNKRQALPKFAKLAIENALILHADNYTQDPKSGKRVSFGLIRMANIQPIVQVAMEIYATTLPEDTRVFLCTYHSQYPLILRSEIEKQLDRTLKRHDPNAVYSDSGIRTFLDTSQEKNIVFIVLASPVAETGRDHDYDWAIVEPSSMRSIIQLLGRVRRHRRSETPWGKTNVAIFSTNLRHHMQPDEAAFAKPGFEDDDNYTLDSHDLNVIFPAEILERIDSRPRIQANPSEALLPRNSLVDLEHTRTADTFDSARTNAASWWNSPAHALLTALLPIKQPFRNSTIPEVDLYLRPNQDDSFDLVKLTYEGRGRNRNTQETTQNSLLKRVDPKLLSNPQVQPWAHRDYLETLQDLADEYDSPKEDLARRFGQVCLAKSEQGWLFDEKLGFSKG
jgi:CRISPR-associated endonuclease/helicase Cas3